MYRRTHTHIYMYMYIYIYQPTHIHMYIYVVYIYKHIRKSLDLRSLAVLLGRGLFLRLFTSDRTVTRRLRGNGRVVGNPWRDLAGWVRKIL
jgi:hypothetical protein